MILKMGLRRAEMSSFQGFLADLQELGNITLVSKGTWADCMNWFINGISRVINYNNRSTDNINWSIHGRLIYIDGISMGYLIFDDWFGRSACDPLAAICLPEAFTDGLALVGRFMLCFI